MPVQNLNTYVDVVWQEMIDCCRMDEDEYFGQFVNEDI